MTEIPVGEDSGSIQLGCPYPDPETGVRHEPNLKIEGRGYGGEALHFYVECSCGAISVIYMVPHPDDIQGPSNVADEIHRGNESVESLLQSVREHLHYELAEPPHILVNGTPFNEEYPQSIELYE